MKKMYLLLFNTEKQWVCSCLIQYNILLLAVYIKLTRRDKTVGYVRLGQDNILAIYLEQCSEII